MRGMGFREGISGPATVPAKVRRARLRAAEKRRRTRAAIQRLLTTVAIAVIASAMPALARKKLAPVYPVTETMRIDRELPILVAPPEIAVRSYKVGRKERQVDVPIAAIAQWIRRTEIDALRERGFSLSGENPWADEALADLVGASERLVRRTVATEDGAAVLRDACEGRENTAILAQHLRIKTAPRGTWDPVSGQSTLDMSNSNLRGVLFDCQSYKRLWEGEMYIRTLPRVGNTDFEAAVNGIFANLKKEED